MTIDMDFARPTAAQLETLAIFPTPTLHEALGQSGAPPYFIKPIYLGMKVCGAALTIDCPPHDNLSIDAAAAQAREGDDEGAVFIPRARIDAVIADAQAREDKEAAMRKKLRGGASTLDLLDLHRYIEAK